MGERRSNQIGRSKLRGFIVSIIERVAMQYNLPPKIENGFHLDRQASSLALRL